MHCTCCDCLQFAALAPCHTYHVLSYSSHPLQGIHTGALHPCLLAHAQHTACTTWLPPHHHSYTAVFPPSHATSFAGFAPSAEGMLMLTSEHLEWLADAATASVLDQPHELDHMTLASVASMIRLLVVRATSLIVCKSPCTVGCNGK